MSTLSSKEQSVILELRCQLILALQISPSISRKEQAINATRRYSWVAATNRPYTIRRTQSTRQPLTWCTDHIEGPVLLGFSLFFFLSYACPRLATPGPVHHFAQCKLKQSRASRQSWKRWSLEIARKHKPVMQPAKVKVEWEEWLTG